MSFDNPLVPVRYRVVDHRLDSEDIATITLDPLDHPITAPRPGQFNMLSAFGVGEAAISVSSDPKRSPVLEHTIRDVGAVSHSLANTAPGDVVGVRGPYGTDWPIDDIGDHDVVVVAGGIGIAPLRGAIIRLVETLEHGRTGDVLVLVGARTPDQIIYSNDLDDWRTRGARVRVTVDVADADWLGPVGVVTQLISDASFDARSAMAFVCGPEIMMRFSARTLIDRGVSPERIFVSLERNMNCGVGFCGHCQLGPFLICRDGPVVPYSPIAEYEMKVAER
ncbi:MAG: FAD/NAD(P)-binding protein [Acidimicrobiales bacterium]